MQCGSLNRERNNRSMVPRANAIASKESRGNLEVSILKRGGDKAESVAAVGSQARAGRDSSPRSDSKTGTLRALFLHTVLANMIATICRKKNRRVQAQAQISISPLHPPTCRRWPQPLSRGCPPGSVAWLAHPSSAPPGGKGGRLLRTRQ